MGTDTNSLVMSPRPTAGPDLKPGAPMRIDLYDRKGFPASPSQTGTKTWNYNLEGVAHYGMYADFLKDIRLSNTAGLVDKDLFRSADYFWQMWLRIEAQKRNVPTGP